MADLQAETELGTVEVRRGFGEFEISTLADNEFVAASGLRDGGWVVYRESGNSGEWRFKMAEPKINIHCDIFQALLALATIVRERPQVDPFAVLHEAEYVIQEVLAGRMDFDTVTPGDDLRIPTIAPEDSKESIGT